MKTASIVASLAALASGVVAASYNVTFVAKSTDSSINGAGLYSIHEGAAINYFFLASDGGSAETILYDSDKNLFTSPYTGVGGGEFIPFGLLIYENMLWYELGEQSDYFSISDATLAVDGSTKGFYACKDTLDPYDYSLENYQVLYYNSTETAPSKCIPISIVVDRPASASSSVVPTSTVISSSALVANTSSIAVPTVFPNSTATSLVVKTTTTYCPPSSTYYPNITLSTSTSKAPNTTTSSASISTFTGGAAVNTVSGGALAVAAFIAFLF
ncbi:uncharacterized protein V1516DRAFT_710479 [Lipomyces oligophaga]|uniref:uncharacterized protein n=1 Tax=Lipomyces oligophaga TaxID=45792 RepID=UPI0034CED5DC